MHYKIVPLLCSQFEVDRPPFLPQKELPLPPVGVFQTLDNILNIF